MKKKKNKNSSKLISIFGVFLGLLIALIIYAPASWLAKGIQVVSRDYIKLINPLGRIWQGSASFVLASGSSGSDQLALPTRLNWSFGLNLQDGLILNLFSECCFSQDLKIKVTHKDLKIDNSKLFLPLSLIKGLGTPFNTIALQGNLSLDLNGFSVDWQGKTAINGELNFSLDNVATRLTVLPVLGSYLINLSGSGNNGAFLNVSTKKGYLILEGSGIITSNKFIFTGTGEAALGKEEELANILLMLGPRRNGKSIINLIS